jgi:ABC-type glycerol-3-phosphate transport system permease component
MMAVFGWRKKKARNKTRARLGRSAKGDIGIFMALCGFGFFMVLPFVYSLVQSVKPLEELFVFPPRFFTVVHPTLDNYRQLGILTSNLWVPLWRYVFNSAFVTVAGTAAHVALASMAAYVLAKFKFPGSAWLFEMVVLALMFTGSVTAVPQYVVLARSAMINSYWAMILPAVAGPMGLFLMKQNMGQIPDAVMEAARIDGAGMWKGFWLVAMPVVKPAWLTLSIFAFQALWNGAGSNSIYTETLKVLPAVLSQIASAGIARTGAGAAAAVILMVPPVLVFVITQSNVVETMAHSGIK